MKNYIKFGIVLFLIASISSGILSYVNNLTITEKDIANFCTNLTSEATYLDISPNSLETHLEYYTYHKTMDNKESSSKKIKI